MAQSFRNIGKSSLVEEKNYWPARKRVNCDARNYEFYCNCNHIYVTLTKKHRKDLENIFSPISSGLTIMKLSFNVMSEMVRFFGSIFFVSHTVGFVLEKFNLSWACITIGMSH